MIAANCIRFSIEYNIKFLAILMMQIKTSEMDLNLKINIVVVVLLWSSMIAILIYVACMSKFDDSPEERNSLLYGVWQDFSNRIAFILTWSVLLLFRIAICFFILHPPSSDPVKTWKIMLVSHVIFHALTSFFLCGVNDLNQCKDWIFGSIVNTLGFLTCIFMVFSNGLSGQELNSVFRQFLAWTIVISGVLIFKTVVETGVNVANVTVKSSDHGDSEVEVPFTEAVNSIHIAPVRFMDSLPNQV